MQRIILLLLLLFLIPCLNYAQKLKVSDNKRFLIYESGQPFFWMADTAWELFHRCDREQATMYLEKRAAQGFNVIQAVALAELSGLTTANPYGALPLHNLDPKQPNDDYFKHVDFIIKKADSLGMYIALLPTWGDKLFTNNWGVGPEVFDESNAAVFGKWIGTRYKDYDNIIWIIGGDRNPREQSKDVAVWNAMAEAIAQAAGGYDATLMSYHPQPNKAGGSSRWFHNEPWLDFNMHQTGHCANQPTYELIKNDYKLKPIKPVIDGEPLYEDHPNCFNAKELGYSSADDIRRIMYWNVFAGGFGQTYGCHDVWQMYTPDKQGINGPLRPWSEALDLPMANQVQHLKNLMLSRPFLSRIPMQSMVLTEQKDNNDYSMVTTDADGRYAMVYFPQGKPLTIDLSTMNGTSFDLWWYDPRTGNTYKEKTLQKTKAVEIKPPTTGKGHDWVAVIDTAKETFAPPGTISE